MAVRVNRVLPCALMLLQTFVLIGATTSAVVPHEQATAPSAPVQRSFSRELQAAGGCSGNFLPPLVDTELGGAGVGSPTAMPADNCCDACIAEPGCTGFVVFGSTCYMKSGPLTQTALADRTGYLRVVSPPPPSLCSTAYQAPLADIELNGAGVGSPVQTPVENCCDACDTEPTCTGFVLFGSTCYLKSGALTQASASGRTGYLHSARIASPPALPPPSSCDANYDAPQYDTELSGQDVGSPTSTPVENCCTACDALGTCKGFVILGGTCYLKGGTLSEVNLAGRIAYVKKGNSVVLALPPSPPPTAGSPPPGACTDIFNPPIADTELSGSDVGAQAMPVEQCCAACDQDFACEGFVVFGPTCYLKGGGVSQIPLAGRTAYIHATRVSAPPPPSPPPSSCSVHFGAPLVDHDLSGSGVGSPTQIPVENCCIACDADTACIGFVVFGSEGRGHRTRATPDHHAHLVCHGPVVCGPLGVTLP